MMMQPPQDEKEITPSPTVVFIGGIPSGAQEHQLKTFLEKQFGPIDKVKIIQDKETKKSKGYGFVRFYEESHAQMLKDKGLVTFMNKNLNVGDAFKGERTNPNPVRKDTRKPTSPVAQPTVPIGSAALRGEMPAAGVTPENIMQCYYANMYYQLYGTPYLYTGFPSPYNYAAAALAQQAAAPLAAAQWEALASANSHLLAPGAIRQPAKKVTSPAAPQLKPRGPAPAPKTPLPLAGVAPTASASSSVTTIAKGLSANAPTFVPSSIVAAAPKDSAEGSEPAHIPTPIPTPAPLVAAEPTPAPLPAATPNPVATPIPIAPALSALEAEQPKFNAALE